MGFPVPVADGPYPGLPQRRLPKRLRPGLPTGYTNTGIEPAVGGPHAAQPTLNPLSGRKEALAAARRKLLTLQQAQAKFLMRRGNPPATARGQEAQGLAALRPIQSPAVQEWNQERADPARRHTMGLPPVDPLRSDELAGTHGLGGPLTLMEQTAAKMAARDDAMAGALPTDIGPWVGQGQLPGERDPSTTELLRQDNPELLESIAGRRSARRDRGLPSLAERREAVAAQAGAPGRRGLDIRAGRRQTEQEQAIAGQTESYRAMAAGNMGAGLAAGGLPPDPNALESLTNIIRGPQGGQGLPTGPPSTSSEFDQLQEQTPEDEQDFYNALREQGVDASEAEWHTTQRFDLNPGLFGMLGKTERGLQYPGHLKVSRTQRLSLEYAAAQGDKEARKKLKQLEKEELERSMDRIVGGASGLPGAGLLLPHLRRSGLGRLFPRTNRAANP